MSCETDDPELLAIDRELEKILGPPACLGRKVRAEDTTLDEVFASRSHVRIMRTVLRDGARENLTASEIGRRARVAHPRALKVLRELEAVGVLSAYRGEGYSLYERNTGHPLI